jgi:glutamine amidotransferase
MQTVVLIDYGSGNLRSAEKALQAAARTLDEATVIETTADPDVVRRADRIVLPGVGAFAACRAALYGREGLTEAMSDAVQGRGAPFLGVCVGMQLLATRGLEFGTHPGLDWIAGEVRRLNPDDPTRKVPHMGWNDVEPTLNPLFGNPPFGGATTTQMYFTHSYAFHAAEADDVAATTEHGQRIAAAVARHNIAGVQFHPEKSQGAGLALIARFLEWRP